MFAAVLFFYLLTTQINGHAVKNENRKGMSAWKAESALLD